MTDKNAAGRLPVRAVTASQLVAYNMAWYRRAAGLTQAEMGERLGGWSNAAVSAAERSWDGRRVRQFGADEIVRLALALGVPVIALLLPPPDDGTGAAYVLDGEPGRPGVTSLLPVLAAPRGDGTPVLAAFRDRVMALGVSGTYAGAWHEPITAQEAREAAAGAEAGARERAARVRATREAAAREAEARITGLREFERKYRAGLITSLESLIAELRAGAGDQR